MVKSNVNIPVGTLITTDQVIHNLKEKFREDMALREERIDELVRSLKDLQEAYEELVAERERMLKKSMKVSKVSYNDGLFIYRSKTLTRADLDDLGFEKGDELRLVIVKTPLAKIIEKK